jgi:flagellar biosynthesis protein FlhF
MRLYNYVAKHMTDAMGQIRKELGKEAIILSVEEEGTFIRVIAAVDHDGSLEASSNLKGKTNPFSPQEKHKPWLCSWLDLLSQYHVPEKIQSRVLERCQGLQEHHPMAYIRQCIQKGHLYPYGQIQKAPVMAIGTFGSGKTVTLAKMAHDFVKKGEKVVLASLDRHKSGAVSQLNTLGRSLGVSVVFGSHPKEILSEIHDKDAYLLIDTPSVNPYDEKDMAQRLLWKNAFNAEFLWVATAQCDGHYMNDITPLFNSIGAHHVAITGLDVCGRYGGVLSLLLQEKILFTYASNSPYIAHSLRWGGPELLGQILKIIPENLSKNLDLHKNISLDKNLENCA